jgi:hypothetical protein
MSDMRAASCGACRVTRSQNTAKHHKNARSGGKGSCKNLQEVLGSVEFNGLIEVCMVVSMRVVAAQHDAMNRNWNAMNARIALKRG